MLIKSKEYISSEELTDYPVADRLIKLPIENYFDILKIKPNSAQIAITNAVNHPDIRFIVAAISRRVGKTFISNIIGNLISLYPGTNILIIAPNYSLSSISWDLQLSLIRRFEIETIRCNAKDKIIELENNSMIRIGSISQVDSCVGRSYDLIIFDEAALDDKGGDAFNVQLRPTLDKDLSKCIFISTPRGNNYFKEFYELGFTEPDWFSIKADWHENPRASERDILSAKKTMTKEHFLQEYYADFVAVQGKIYEFNDANICERVFDPIDTIIGVDLGYKDPTAIVVCQSDGERWHLVDCYQAKKRSTRAHAEVLIALMEKYNVDFVYIDSANQQMRHDFAVEYDIYAVNAKKDVNLGIGYCQGLINNDLVTVDPKCKDVIETFANYSWDIREGIQREKPKHDSYCHMADAIRYALYTHSYSLIQPSFDSLEEDEIEKID